MKIHPQTKQIKDAVDQILIDHPRGEDFFNVLDEYIRDKAGLDLFKHALEQIGDNILILSGGFGISVASKIRSGELPNISYMLFRGGIRKTGLVIINDIHLTKPLKTGVFFDDTIYGGRTFREIQKWVHDVTDVKVDKAFVIYDGRPDKLDDVDSVFRFYDFFKADPNYKFEAGSNSHLENI